MNRKKILITCQRIHWQCGSGKALALVTKRGQVYAQAATELICKTNAFGLSTYLIPIKPSSWNNYNLCCRKRTIRLYCSYSRITKALHKSDFEHVNYLYTKNLVDALVETRHLPDSFIFISSLSAYGVGDEKGYTPISAHQTPRPNTAYGRVNCWRRIISKAFPIFLTSYCVRPASMARATKTISS